jgi:hypothetical protein
MHYDLCTPKSREPIGFTIENESPVVGGTVRYAAASWRVVEIVWMRNLDNNRVSSGLLCVERIDDEDQ